MSKVIVITSGKGGVGKTTCTANIGISLSRLGKKVAVIDADIGLRNLDMVLGFEEMMSFNIIDVILGNVNPAQAMISHSRYPDFYLLPASAKTGDDIITPKRMCRLVDDMKDSFDYILIDSPAGIENGFYSAVAPADEALIVVNPEISSVRDADRITEILKGYKDLKIRLIINRINQKMVDKGEMISPSDISDILGLDIFGLIPEDRSVIISSNKGLPVVETGSPSADALKNIAKRINGQIISFSEMKEKESLIAKMTKKFMRG